MNRKYFLAILICIFVTSCNENPFIIPGDDIHSSMDIYIGNYGIDMKIENITQGSSIFCKEGILFNNDPILDISYGDTIIISASIESIYLPECENIVDLIFLDKEVRLNKFPYEYTYIISNMTTGIYPCRATYSRKGLNTNDNYTSVGRETTLYLNYK